MQKSDPAQSRYGFTLIELILVMAVLAAILAFSAPTLSRSFRARHLEEEAARFLAVTEYARNETVSLGVPMFVWVEPASGRFGVAAADGYLSDDGRRREYTLNPDIRLELTGGAPSRGMTHVVEFTPDGTPDPLSAESVRLIDRFDSAMTLARTDDGWGYEIVKEQR
jgi:prepilin-type N-terminal cleavage/methylation domain-containing protein